MTFRKALIILLLAELFIGLLASAMFGFDISGLQALTRFSGRLSLVIFSILFILLPFHREKLTSILSNKFYLIFAIAHFIHFIELFLYNRIIGGAFIPLRVAGGALAYGLILSMPFLIDRVTVRKQIILQNIYLFYLWLVFFITYLPRVQGKMPHVGGRYYEFVILFAWICILLIIRIMLSITHRKQHA